MKTSCAAAAVRYVPRLLPCDWQRRVRREQKINTSILNVFVVVLSWSYRSRIVISITSVVVECVVASSYRSRIVVESQLWSRLKLGSARTRPRVPSVCLSVRLSVTRVDRSKTVEVRIMKFSPYSSPIPLVFARQVSSRNSDGFPLSGGAKQGWVEKTSYFSALCINISKTVRETSKVTIDD